MLKNAFAIATSVVLLVVAAPAAAEQVKRNLPACVSEDLLDEFITYVTKGDSNGARQLLMSGKCTMLSAGAAVSVISPGFMVATIRYNGTKLFTPSEAVR